MHSYFFPTFSPSLSMLLTLVLGQTDTGLTKLAWIHQEDSGINTSSML